MKPAIWRYRFPGEKWQYVAYDPSRSLVPPFEVEPLFLAPPSTPSAANVQEIVPTARLEAIWPKQEATPAEIHDMAVELINRRSKQVPTVVVPSQDVEAAIDTLVNVEVCAALEFENGAPSEQKQRELATELKDARHAVSQALCLRTHAEQREPLKPD